MTVATEQGLAERIQALRLVNGELKKWLRSESAGAGHNQEKKQLREAVDALSIQLDKLESEPTVLTIVFLGGTGVGKSTLLNSLAGSRIASSGLVRPTTKFPTVYHHADIDLAALPEPFRHCRQVSHDRSELKHKILIDTPDVDGTVIEHHERLKQILPVADAVLYVGSGEKYHDRAAWQLLLEHAPTRGFAFVLNKWDRCLAAHDEDGGRAPDEDFRRSLQEGGFQRPLLFRLCGRQWEARRVDGNDDIPLIEDDFERLRQWIEHELDERLVHEIKARGIARLIERTSEIVRQVLPADWLSKRQRLATRWQEALRHGVEDHTNDLVEATDGQAKDLERHFSRLGREKVGGLMGVYLHLADRLIHLRGALLQIGQRDRETQMQRIAAKCVSSIPATARQQHREALRDRLLTLASQEGWNVDQLAQDLNDAQTGRPVVQLNEEALAQVLAGELRTLEADYADPRGSKRIAHVIVRWLCTWLPVAILATIGIALVYSLVTFQFWGVGEFFSAVLLFALVIAGMHLLLIWVFPVHWSALREKLRDRLEEGLLDRWGASYFAALDRYTERIAEERTLLLGVQGVLGQIQSQMEQAASHSTDSLFAGESTPDTSSP